MKREFAPHRVAAHNTTMACSQSSRSHSEDSCRACTVAPYLAEIAVLPLILFGLRRVGA